MLMWGQFFTGIRNYFTGQEKSIAEETRQESAQRLIAMRHRDDPWFNVRVSAVKDFCSPVFDPAAQQPAALGGMTAAQIAAAKQQALVINTQRQIYMEEGSLAIQKAAAMQRAINSSSAEFEVFKKAYEAFQNTLNQPGIVQNKSTVSIDEKTPEQLYNEALAEMRNRIVSIEPILAGAETKNQSSSSPEKAKSLTNASIEKHLEQKVIFDLNNSDKKRKFTKTYIAPETAYSYALNSGLRLSVVGSGATRSLLGPPIPMPTFSNTIGYGSILIHPVSAVGYALDGVRKILLETPARAICKGLDRISSGAINITLKALIAGPLIVANVAMFAVSKLTSRDAIKDTFKSIWNTVKGTTGSEVSKLSMRYSEAKYEPSDKSGRSKLKRILTESKISKQSSASPNSSAPPSPLIKAVASPPNKKYSPLLSPIHAYDKVSPSSASHAKRQKVSDKYQTTKRAWTETGENKLSAAVKSGANPDAETKVASVDPAVSKRPRDRMLQRTSSYGSDPVKIRIDIPETKETIDKIQENEGSLNSVKGMKP